MSVRRYDEDFEYERRQSLIDEDQDELARQRAEAEGDDDE